MKIGLAYTLKTDDVEPGRPDDWQEEFDSPDTVRSIQTALESLGHIVVPIGDGRSFVQKMLASPPDIVFNIAEGRGVARSREARVPAVCELLGVPCTGSDPLALAASLDKDVARRLAASAGLHVPKGVVVAPGRDFDDASLIYPAFIKPAWEGSSKGIRGRCIVNNREELYEAVGRLSRDYRQPLLVEEFINGDELTVGVVGNDPAQVLGIMRVLPQKPTDRFVYSLEMKRDWRNQLRYETPPTGYDADTIARVESSALTAFAALGCSDVARIDFRLRDSVPYFLEANPLPGLNSESGDLVLIAKGAGISHTELIGRILASAMDRLKN